MSQIYSLVVQGDTVEQGAGSYVRDEGSQRIDSICSGEKGW